MTDTASQPLLLQLTAQIVAAHTAHNHLTSEALLGLIGSVYTTLATAGVAAPIVEKAQPAVPIRKSVFPDHIVCLEDGKKLKTLKRHLATSYGMTPEQYPGEVGVAGELPDGGAGLCGAAVDAGKEHRARAEACGEAGTAATSPCRSATGSARPVATAGGGRIDTSGTTDG